jgi:CheY-like chemotaxis protein
MISAEKPVHILLVEDSSDDVFFFRRAIQKCGVSAEIHVAADGLEAKDYLLGKGQFGDKTAHPKPDIVFLDLKLPHINGFEVLEWMKLHTECPRVPIVVLTSSSHPEDQERAESLGALLYLTKPLTPEQLRQVLQRSSLARPTGSNAGEQT